MLSECIYKVLMASGVVTSSDACDLSGAIESAVLEAQSTDQRLLNLLCRIHRDGGHYIAEHGLDKAVEDADLRVAEQNAALDAQAKQEPVAWGLQIPGEIGFRQIWTVKDEPFNAALNRWPEAYKDAIQVPLYAAPVVQPGMAKLREHVAWCMKGSASLVEKAFNEVPGQGEVSLQVALGEKLKWWMRTAELIAAAEGKG